MQRGVSRSLESDAASYVDLSQQRHLPVHATTGTVSHTFNSTIILAELEWQLSITALCQTACLSKEWKQLAALALRLELECWQSQEMKSSGAQKQKGDSRVCRQKLAQTQESPSDFPQAQNLAGVLETKSDQGDSRVLHFFLAHSRESPCLKYKASCT